MTVAGVPHRTLWQITVGKDSSDPSSFRSPEAPHTADNDFEPEVSPVVVNPSWQVYLIRASREIHWNLETSSWHPTDTVDRSTFSNSGLLHTTGLQDSGALGSKPFSLHDS
jgi:hypothetical protein